MTEPHRLNFCHRAEPVGRLVNVTFDDFHKAVCAGDLRSWRLYFSPASHWSAVKVIKMLLPFIDAPDDGRYNALRIAYNGASTIIKFV